MVITELFSQLVDSVAFIAPVAPYNVPALRVAAADHDGWGRSLLEVLYTDAVLVRECSRTRRRARRGDLGSPGIEAITRMCPCRFNRVVERLLGERIRGEPIDETCSGVSAGQQPRPGG